MSAAKKRGLGRGLDALLGPKGAVTPVTVAAVAEPQPGEVLRKLQNGQVPVYALSLFAGAVAILIYFTFR